MPVVVIRPQPGCDATVAAAWALGLDARGFPLFAVHPLPWGPPPAEEVDALLLGSANVQRHAGPALARYRGKPAYCVGEATARAARAAGLDVIATGTDRLQEVLAGLRPEHRRLLRLCGRERVALAVPAGVVLDERPVYFSEPLSLPSALAELLRAPALVLAHSAGAVRHFAALVDGHGLDRARIALAALAPRIAAAAGGGWAAARAAQSVEDAALLALAQEMCQEAAGREKLSGA
ncbi:MAG: uroporphyrinogen-III synthase [Novosphingobium sp.]